MKASDLLNLIKVRYQAPEWACLTQVANGTGASGGRYADAVVMNLWPSRGLEIIGIEIKVSRSDWIAELRNPKKADDMMKHCDSWLLCVSDRAIVQPGELPKGWGLLYPFGKELDKLRCDVEPERKEAVINRSFMAAVIRRVHEQLTPEAKLKESESAAYDRGMADGKESQAHQIEWASRDHKRLQESVAAFQKSSGIDISNTWCGGALGDAVRTVMNGGLTRAMSDLERIKGTCLKLAEGVTAELESLRKSS